jgi:hypothetical protein
MTITFTEEVCSRINCFIFIDQETASKLSFITISAVVLGVVGYQ